MTETVGGKIQETQIQRYRSTRGINYDSVPWKLWEKSKKLFWDPADLDFSQDAIDWQEMPEIGTDDCRDVGSRVHGRRGSRDDGHRPVAAVHVRSRTA